MHYISVSSTGSFSVSAGTSGELYGFTVKLLENSRGRLRARSFTLGKATVVILRVGELDEMLQRMDHSRREGDTATGTPSVFSPRQHALMYRYPLHDSEGDDVHVETPNDLFVVVGSDDGYSDTTLLRVAALISELCLFLNIDPLRGGPNAPVLKQVLLYVESRLMQHDISLLCQMIERLVRPAIITTGFSSGARARNLLDDLARQSFLRNPPTTGYRAPNYIALLLGHKLVLETTPQWSQEASRINGVEQVALHDSDRYLAYCVTCAFFSAPLQYSCYEASYRERQLCELEGRLQRFGIHRHNVTRLASKRCMEAYTEALRQDNVKEYRRALFFEHAYDRLRALMTVSCWRYPRMARNDECHLMGGEGCNSIEESRTFQLDNICFRNSEIVGCMQLRWIPAVGLRQEDDERSDGNNDVGGGNPLMETSPLGYGVCFVYLPPRNAREKDRRRRSSTVGNEQALVQFTRDVLGSMETSLNSFQWIFSPPVESYEIPGLIHFVAVDRRTNGGVVASFHHMMHQKSTEVQDAVMALRRLVALNISRSHTLLQAGYSEGLWGHLGMQFFYCVCNLHEGAATAVVAAPSALSSLPLSSQQEHKQQQQQQRQKSFPLDEDSGVTTGATESLLGSLNAHSMLPRAALSHLVLRPMLLPDFTSDEPEGVCVVEVYAVFVGAMSPAEVCREVEELLRSRVLPSWNTQ